MTRLIDADVLIEKLKNDFDSIDIYTDKDQFVIDCISILNKAPTVLADNYSMGYQDGIKKVLSERAKGEWKVKGIGINIQKNIWHVVCPKCNCDMFTEFTSYCPNCGEPKKEINIAELNMRGDNE